MKTKEYYFYHSSCFFGSFLLMLWKHSVNKLDGPIATFLQIEKGKHSNFSHNPDPQGNLCLTAPDFSILQKKNLHPCSFFLYGGVTFTNKERNQLKMFYHYQVSGCQEFIFPSYCSLFPIHDWTIKFKRLYSIFSIPNNMRDIGSILTTIFKKVYYFCLSLCKTVFKEVSAATSHFLV